jgi:hypothetical protein
MRTAALDSPTVVLRAFVRSARRVASGGVRRLAVGMALASLAGAAAAAQITLYDQAGFGGARLSLRGDTPEIARAGFNDRTSSVVVTSGRWELCTDNGFRGTCTTLEPGEYPNLDGRLANRISSVRLLGGDDAYPGDRGRAAPPYDERGRPVGPMAALPAPVPRGGYAGQPGRLVLFEQEGLRGASVAIVGPVGDLTHGPLGGWGAASAVVEGGNWMLCPDPGFNGACIEVGPGRYDDFGRAGLARPVASARPADLAPGRAGWDERPGRDGRYERGGRGAGPDERRGWDGRSAVELFSELDFGGARYAANGDVRALEDFNDRAASAIVHSGRWEFCGDFDYRGGCAIFGPGSYPELGALTRHLSSVRRAR